jgi:hypothetical protein
MIEIHSTQLPPEITYAQITSGIGTTPVLFTPAKAKGMIEGLFRMSQLGL